MPETIGGLPYPASTAPVAEGAVAIQALAEAIEARDSIHYEQRVTDFAVTALSEAAAQIVFPGAAITYRANDPVICEVAFPSWVHTGVTGTALVLFDGAAVVAQMFFANNFAAAAPPGAIRAAMSLTPTAGPHTYNVRAWTGAATATLRGGAGAGSGQWAPSYFRIARR